MTAKLSLICKLANAIEFTDNIRGIIGVDISCLCALVYDFSILVRRCELLIMKSGGYYLQGLSVSSITQADSAIRGHSAICLSPL